VAAGGGGTQGITTLTTIAANQAAITRALTFAEANPTAVAFAQKNATILGFAAANPTLVADATRYSAQLGALAKVPTSVTSYLEAHAAAVQKAAKDSPGQWKDWYWICVAACLFFVGSVFLMRGRWSPKKAREDEEAHEKMVQEELARLSVG
jgi:hypothetical protein